MLDSPLQEKASKKERKKTEEQGEKEMNRVYRIFSLMAVVAMVFGLLAGAVTAGAPRSDVTVWVEDTISITVASGGEVKTFYHLAGRPVTQSLPVSDRYVFSAGTPAHPIDIMVLEGNHLADASYIPDQPYKAGSAVVDHAGVYTVIREVKPKGGYSVGPAPAPVGNELQLRIVDPQMTVVVRDGDDRVTFVSRPEAEMNEMASAGPYIAGATNSHPYDILIFDGNWDLVGRSFEYNQPYTRWQAPIPGPGLYWIFPQSVPMQYLIKK